MDRHRSGCEMSRQADGSVSQAVRHVTLRQTERLTGGQKAREPPTCWLGQEGAPPPRPASPTIRAGCALAGRRGGGASMRTGRGQHARRGDCGRGAARVLAVAAGGGARVGRGRARRRRVAFRAKAHGGKVAGRRGAAPGRAASVTPSRFPAPAAPPWTTSVSERGAEGGGSEGRAAPGRAGASERWGLRDPTLGGSGPRTGPCWLGFRGAGIPSWA